MSAELKPCPFCGEHEKLEYDGDGECIVCETCGSFGPNPDAALANDLTATEEEVQAHATAKWNARAFVPEPAPIPCEFPGCGRPADYEGWYRRRDPFIGTPTGHIVRIAFCESCKSHPHLCVNEQREEKESNT